MRATFHQPNSKLLPNSSFAHSLPDGKPSASPPPSLGESSDSSRGKPASRWHSLDVSRCAAMFLVVALHSALAYVTIPPSNLFWAVRDPARHFGFDLFFWWALGVSMPIFFMLSGLFAAKTLTERGIDALARDRAKRILMPALGATATILPISLLIWNYGLFVSNRCPANELFSLHYTDLELRRNVWGPGHLWFLYYLIYHLLVLGGIYAIARKTGYLRVLSRMARAIRTPAQVLIAAVPATTLILWFGHWRLDIDPVMGMHNRLLPDPVRLLHHFVFFAAGAALYPGIRDRGIDWLRQGAGWMLLASVPCFAVRAWLLSDDLRQPLDGVWAWLSAVSGSLFAWCSLFGCVGTIQRFCRQRSPVVSYLADASYWVYLAHFPIAGLIQANLHDRGLSGFAKFAYVLTLTLCLGLASYHVAIRRTWVGTWLHGLRGPKPSSVKGTEVNPIRRDKDESPRRVESSVSALSPSQ